jgi:two-component system response regulator AtoC
MMSAVQILVVDDELAIRQVLAANLHKENYTVEDVGSGEEALDRLGKGDVDIAICDMKMPGLSGIDVMRKATESGIDTTFLLMTAYASVDTAVEAMKLGAFDYMLKPVRIEEVLHQIKQIENIRGLRNENRLLRRIVLGDNEKLCEMTSLAMQEIERIVSKVATTDSTVLITGESGTGKGVIARSIHKQSPRSGAPFIPVNCGSIPENLIESEFFGHTKGAFTSADRAKKGLFLEADKGTIFLDEIGELPLHLQVKLLHVIEEKEFRPVGSSQVKRVNVRIIAATNRNLAEMVARGGFREDLYFRIDVFHIHIPPLRERRGDIAKLVRFFLEHGEGRFAQGRKISIEPEAENLLIAYDWQGNVREIENIIARALILADGERITVADLPSHITRLGASGNGSSALSAGTSLRELVRAHEYNLIQVAIEDAGGDRRAAAQALGIGLSTLYRKLEEFGPPT